jgi:peptidyl-prolyl cis-trans isomerase C
MGLSLQSDVVVNGEVIPAAAIAAEAQNHPAPAGKPGLAWRAAARALTVRALLLQEAARMGLTPEPRALGPGRRETDEEALARAVLESRLAPEPVTEEAARAAYVADPGDWRGPTLYDAAHILFAAAPDDGPGREAAMAQARAVIDRLTAEPGAFAGLAAELSACPSRANGGRLGQIATGDTVPEFEAALDAIAEGTLGSEPVVTRYGVHVVRVDGRLPGAVPPFEAVRARVIARLEKAAWARAARALTAELLAGAALSGVDFPKAA